MFTPRCHATLRRPLAGLVLAALGAIAASAQVVDFEDLPLGTTTTCGDPPTISQGVPYLAETFYFIPSGSNCGRLLVQAGIVNPSHNLFLNSTTARFLFPGPVTSLVVDYGYFGGNVNLRVNGDLINAPTPAGLVGVHGIGFLGLVNVQDTGSQLILTPLSGYILDFAIGGQEMAIDNLRYQIDDCINSTPPIADIQEPLDGACVCDQVKIVGTADDPDDGLASYELEYRPLFTPGWILFDSGTTPVVNDQLGIFSPTALGLPQGIYLIRLTVTNDCGDDEEDLIAIYYDNALDELRLDSPLPGDILGGVICFDGTVFDSGCFDRYTVKYRAAGSADPFVPVDPANPTYFNVKINQVFATWDTLALAIPDGDYEIEIIASTDCGYSDSINLVITVDNTVPIAEITDPLNCASVTGQVTITGTAFDANLAGWVLQFTGGPYNNWQTIASGNTSVVNNVLGVWDTTGLPPCCYTVRLVVTDKAILNCNPAIHHQAEFEISLEVNAVPGDLNGDQCVDFADFAILSAAWGNCP